MRRSRLAAAIGILVLAPIGAEYLVGYDTSTGNVSELLWGLLFFAPLYGGPALIIREVALRAGVGWRGRLCWAAAFGVVQAGLVDQSLFNRSYRDISYWEQMVGPTWIPALGFSVAAALNFVIGHLVWSITAPTIMVESIYPTVRDRPWLSRVGLGVTVLLYLSVSVLVLVWHLESEAFVAGPGQLVGAALTTVVLILLGVRLGRSSRPALAARTPSPWLVGAGALVAAVAFEVDQSRVGTVVAVVVLGTALALIARFSRTPGWSAQHLLLIAGGVMLARALMGFLVDPIGDGPLVAKYVHNSAAVLLVLVLVALGWMRTRTDRPDVRNELSVDSWTMNASNQESSNGPAQRRRRGGAHGAGVVPEVGIDRGPPAAGRRR